MSVIKSFKFMRAIFISFFCLCILVQCSKRRPKKGEYEGHFVYESQFQKADVLLTYEIVESNKDWVIIGNGISTLFLDTLYKKKQITGNVFGESYFPYHVTGLIERDGFSTHFKITGTFIQNIQTQSSGLSEFKGTFEIK